MRKNIFLAIPFIMAAAIASCKVSNDPETEVYGTTGKIKTIAIQLGNKTMNNTIVHRHCKQFY